MEFVFSPLTACKSLTVKNSLGAYRLFVLAKGMAENLNNVNVAQVKETACQFVSERQFARDMGAAVRLGLLTIHERKNGTRFFVLTSHVNAALKLGATKTSEAQRSTVSLAVLFGEGWQSFAFTTWQAVTSQNGTRLTSQKKQAQKTGVSPQMQRKYNKTRGVESRSNYAVSNIAANHLDGIKEFSTRAAPFKFKNHKTNQWYLGFRIPSTRVVRAFPNAVNAIGIDGVLRSTNLNASRKGSTLFLHGSEVSFTKAKKRAGARQRDLYIFSHVANSGAGMFTHFAI